MPTGRKGDLPRSTSTSHKGARAVATVIDDALSMGWEVFIPFDGAGVDLILKSPLDSCCKLVEVKTAKNDSLNKYTPWFRDRERPGRQWDMLAVVKKDRSVHWFNSQYETIDVSHLRGRY